jgi:Flp pilus assembly protein TadG
MVRPVMRLPRLVRKIFGDRSANATVVTAFSILSMIGGAGLATDTIQWTLSKRQLQRMADSAALAGAFAKARKQSDDQTKASAQKELDRYTALNIITLNSVPSITQPTTGTYANKSVTVTIDARRALPFSSIFLTTVPTQAATATAAAVGFGEYCGAALMSTTGTGINFGGNADVNLGCGVISNSLGTKSVDRSGSGTLNIDPIGAVGGINGTYNATLQPYTFPIDDPYASLPMLTVPNGCQSNSAANRLAVAPNTSYSPTGTSFCYTDMDVKGSLTFPDHSQIIVNGAFGGLLNVGAQGSLTCHQCTFFLTTSGTDYSKVATVNMNGGSTVDLSAPADASTYDGILFYQDRNATLVSNNFINGSAGGGLDGGLYFPKQVLNFTGDSAFSAACLRLIGWQLTFSGHTGISNSNCDKYKAKGLVGTRIRLVN